MSFPALKEPRSCDPSRKTGNGARGGPTRDKQRSNDREIRECAVSMDVRVYDDLWIETEREVDMARDTLWGNCLLIAVALWRLQ